MITKVKLVQLHEPLFLAGVNFGNKLQQRSGKGELILTHDTDSDHILVDFGGERAHIKNWASFNESTAEKVLVKQMHHPETAGASIKAQVSGPGQGLKFNAQVETPMDKVQGKPGRRPKYQGEESQGE